MRTGATTPSPFPPSCGAALRMRRPRRNRDPLLHGRMMISRASPPLKSLDKQNPQQNDLQAKRHPNLKAPSPQKKKRHPVRPNQPCRVEREKRRKLNTQHSTKTPTPLQPTTHPHKSN